MHKSFRLRLLKMASSVASNRIVCRFLDNSARTIHGILGIGTASAVDSGELASIRTCGPGAVVFDVGANAGQFANLVQSVLKPPYTLYCFEPSKEAFLQLKQNTRNATLSNIALGDSPGRRALHSDRPRNLEHYGISFSHTETVEVRARARCSSRRQRPVRAARHQGGAIRVRRIQYRHPDLFQGFFLLLQRARHDDPQDPALRTPAADQQVPPVLKIKGSKRRVASQPLRLYSL